MSADFRFPSAEQRAAMRASPTLDLPPPAGTPAPSLAVPAADFVLELPPDTFDRPASGPEQQASRGEAPPPAPVSNGVSNRPAAGLTFAGVPVAAIEAVMAERARHFAFGHTIADDVVAVSKNIRALTRRAEKLIVRAAEDLQFRKGDYRNNAKRHLAQAAAMLIAQWDAIEATPEDPDCDF